ncbi:MAG: hypothetical protein MUD08_07090 [Cytophagales bacterium]|jgi:hypothetical protein|nr:hypothetical protein [Cytophagales bacterium]
MLLTLLILVVCLVLQLFLPWWIAAPVAFGLAFWRAKSSREAWLAGFLSIFLLWGAAAFFHNFRNDSILAARVAQVIPVKFPIVLLLLTALIGGVISGLAAWSGYCWKRLFSAKR